MGRMINNGTDVVSFLKEQHEQVKDMFDDVLAVHGDARKQAFVRLRKVLAVHETAEEEIVHPFAKHVVSIGEDVVAARLKEENQAKTALAELEQLDTESADFETKFRALQQAVLAHARAEEKEEFEKLHGMVQ